MPSTVARNAARGAVVELQLELPADFGDAQIVVVKLGLSRGFDTGMKPPFEQFPMKMTSPRDYVRQQARAAGASAVEEQRTKSGGDGITDSGIELR